MPSLFLAIDPALPEPLHVQVYRGIRAALADGRLNPGDRLPSTRELAQDLRVGRNTVLRALQRLEAEGLVTGKVGSGVRVNRSLSAGDAAEQGAGDAPLATPPGQAATEWRPFHIGAPPVDVFPDRTWSRLASRRWRQSMDSLKHGFEAVGFGPLRRAVAEWVHATRGIACDEGQIVITSGSFHGLELAVGAVVRRGDAVWVEDPCRAEVHAVLRTHGARAVPIPVDREGFNTATALRTSAARCAIVTPGCHWPTGVAQSARRRQRLVEWVRSTGGWIIEDDHYATTRFVGRALSTLCALEGGARTIHLGSFASLVFPGLRLGYVVLPASIRDDVVATIAPFSQHAPTSSQAILADFINEGHFARHQRRMREVIAERYAAVSAALVAECGDVLDLVPASAGVHVVGWLPADREEESIVRAAACEAIDVDGISRHRQLAGRPGLVLGYGAWPPDELRGAASRLARAFVAVRGGWLAR